MMKETRMQNRRIAPSFLFGGYDDLSKQRKEYCRFFGKAQMTLRSPLKQSFIYFYRENLTESLNSSN